VKKFELLGLVISYLEAIIFDRKYILH